MRRKEASRRGGRTRAKCITLEPRWRKWAANYSYIRNESSQNNHHRVFRIHWLNNQGTYFKQNPQYVPCHHLSWFCPSSAAGDYPLCHSPSTKLLSGDPAPHAPHHSKNTSSNTGQKYEQKVNSKVKHSTNKSTSWDIWALSDFSRFIWQLYN